jgi:hypothetical protein
VRALSGRQELNVCSANIDHEDFHDDT